MWLKRWNNYLLFVVFTDTEEVFKLVVLPATLSVVGLTVVMFGVMLASYTIESLNTLSNPELNVLTACEPSA
jgi:hypothetical protein